MLIILFYRVIKVIQGLVLVEGCYSKGDSQTHLGCKGGQALIAKGEERQGSVGNEMHVLTVQPYMLHGTGGLVV